MNVAAARNLGRFGTRCAKKSEALPAALTTLLSISNISYTHLFDVAGSMRIFNVLSPARSPSNMLRS